MSEQTASRSGPQAEFLSFLKEGRFMIQRSRSTGKYVFYPRVLVPGSGETDLEWVEASGRGTIYAITVNRARQGNYNIALIDLEEGPRMMACIADCETAPIGAAVTARIVTEEGEPKIVFDLVNKELAA